MKKYISILLSIIISTFILTESIFAYENNESKKYYYPISFSDTNSSKNVPCVPNGIPITITARKNGTGVDVKVGNIGVDPLDKVTVTVSATGHAKSKTKTSSVPPVIGKKFYFDLPMLKCKTTYNATIKIVDGSGKSTKKAKAVLTYSEDYLKKIKWNKGTFGTRGSSVDYHFSKHAKEVGAISIVSYINKAANYRSEIINDIKNKKTSKYTITVPKMSIASKKYKNKKDRRFAILSNSGQEILSFGK